MEIPGKELCCLSYVKASTERDGNKLAQTHPDWKLQSFCYWKQTEHNSLQAEGDKSQISHADGHS